MLSFQNKKIFEYFIFTIIKKEAFSIKTLKRLIPTKDIFFSLSFLSA